MKKLTIILVFMLIFSGVGLTNEYEKELPVESYTHIPHEEFIRRANKTSWEKLKEELPFEYIIVDEENEHFGFFFALPYLPSISWVNNYETRIDMERWIAEFPDTRPILYENVHINLSYTKDLEVENINIYYIDLKHGTIKIDEEKINKIKEYKNYNTIYMKIPLDDLEEISQFTLLTYMEDLEQTKFTWTFKPAE